MHKKRAIISIVNSLHQTSMDFHEFVLYRTKYFPDELNHFLALGPVEKEFFDECKTLAALLNINLIECGGSYTMFWKELTKIIGQLRNENIPSLMHVHMGRSGAISALMNLFRPFKKVPVIMTSHSTYQPMIWRSGLLLPINTLLSDEIVCVSQSAYESLPDFIKYLKREHIHIILNGANIDWIDQTLLNCIKIADETVENNILPRSTNEIRLINVGRLVNAKNQLWLVKLMAELPENIKLTIVGSGPLHQELNNMIKQLNIEHRVSLTGVLPREKVFEELLKADLFISTSTREGLPIAVIEAMAAKMPVVLSNIGPHNEIKEKGPGIPILPLDISKWCEYIKEFTAMSIRERKISGERNRQVVEENFSLKRMHQEYTELYEKLWQL
jgi:glycosyltransferase involved in cell wall biosynthesis